MTNGLKKVQAQATAYILSVFNEGSCTRVQAEERVAKIYQKLHLTNAYCRHDFVAI